MPTFTFSRRPFSVIWPSVLSMASRSAAATSTSSRCLSTWLSRSPSTLSNSPMAGSTESGWATQGRRSRRRPRAACRTPRRRRRLLRGLLVGARGDHRAHAAHRVGAAPVAGLDQQLGVGVHERHGHGHVDAVGRDELGPLLEPLDGAEDVVPAAGVQARRSGRAARTGSRPSGTPRAASRSARWPAPCRGPGRSAPRPASWRRSTSGPRDATPAWAGRSTGPLPRSSRSRALWWMYSAKSMSPPATGSPSTVRWRSSRCQPRGRTSSVAVSSFSAVLLALGLVVELERAADGVHQVHLAADHVRPRRASWRPRSRP